MLFTIRVSSYIIIHKKVIIIMEITLSENLKNLRFKKGNTQEDLASYLDISFQAISKWERNEAYPDITLLPKIAQYYNVNIDDLLGVGKIREAEKVDEYLKRSDSYQRKGDYNSNFAMWTEAVKEFPNNHTVLGGYMSVLPEERTDEVIKIAERLYNEAYDKYGAIVTLCNVYNRLGNEEKAIEYALQLPLAEFSCDHMLTNIYKGGKLVEHIQEDLLVSVQMMDDKIYRMVWHGDLTREEQKKARLYSLKLHQWLCEDGDYGYYNTKVANIYVY
jgi:Predicted transcriptional regulators